MLFEFRRQGNVVRVAAIDPASNTEVVVVGAADAAEGTLRHIARRKLAYVLARQKRAQP